MGRARKKPVEIQFKRIDVPTTISTLEGDMKGNVGDYLVIGVKGEMYPVRKDIFEETYEIIEE